MISFSNPHAQYLSHRDEIDSAIKRVQESGYYVLGPEVDAFEQEFSEYSGTSNAVGVNSGTDALILALKAFGVGHGDEVITVAHTALATIAAILATGAKPVLIDIDPNYFTIDPEKIREAISKKTKAIIAVHLYGQPADMDTVMSLAKEHELYVIEDCAQAAGARYRDKRVGSIGDAGCFSFYPTKNLGCLGDGGMLVTRHNSIASRVRKLRQYGWDDKRVTSEPGLNSRLDEMQAAILRVKLNHLDNDNKKRQMIALKYNEAFAELDVHTPSIAEDCFHVFHLYVIKTFDRDGLISHLRAHDIGASIHYPISTDKEPGYAGKVHVPAELTATADVVSSILTLPIYPELAEDQVVEVIKNTHNFFEGE